MMHLFRYEGSHVRSVLQDNHAKVTPPAEFDDPFEFCRRLDDITPNDRFAWIDHILKAMGEDLFLDQLVSRGIVSNRAEGRKFFHDPAARSAYAVDVDQFARDFIREHQARTSKEFGVVCFTENENDMLMWSRYGRDHKGAMIEFDTNAIETAWGTKLIKVEYKPERPRFKPSMILTDDSTFVLDTVRIKNPAWAGQKEWRALCALADCSEVSIPTGRVYVRSIPEDAVVRVVLGMRFPEDEVNAIAAINKARKKPARLQRARMDGREFRINFNDLK